MADPITMMAVGAAAGGAKGLISGKGISLKDMAIGGALGGLGGVAGGAMGGAGATAGATASEAAPSIMGQELVKDAVTNPLTGGVLDSGTSALTSLTNGGIQAPTSLIPMRDLSQGAVGMTPTSTLGDMFNKYGTVDNTIGAAKMMATMPTNQNHPQASSATPTAAKQMQQALTAGLLDSYGNPEQYTPKKQRYSLLG